MMDIRTGLPVLGLLLTLAICAPARAEDPVMLDPPPLPPPPVLQRDATGPGQDPAPYFVPQPAPPDLTPAAAPPPLAPAPWPRPRMAWTHREWDCPLDSLWHLLHVGAGATLTGSPRLTIVDARVGMLCVRNRSGKADDPGLHLIPEIGYSGLVPGAGSAGESATGGGPTTHLITIGLGVGYGSRWASLSYAPRVLAGIDGRDLALGLRHGLVLRALYEMISVEVAHQVVGAAGTWRHDVVAMGSVNALVLMAVVAHLRR